MRQIAWKAGAIALLALLPAVTVASEGPLPPGSDGRPCQENFTESGEWTSGKSFRSYIELTGSTMENTFRDLGRTIALEGFLSVVTNKDIGLISAYQENSGKKSKINGVVSDAAPGTLRVEVSFLLAPGLRTPGAVARDYLCKLLEATLPPEQRAAQGPESSSILLRTGNGDRPLTTTVGAARTVSHGPVLLFFYDFSGSRAAVRGDSRKPVLLIRSNSDPSRSHTLVRCDSDTGADLRSVKVGSAKSLLKMGLTGKGDLAPDKDWTIPFVAEKEAEGIWRVIPSEELAPGEYGLWDVQGYGVALFGVD